MMKRFGRKLLLLIFVCSFIFQSCAGIKSLVSSKKDDQASSNTAPATEDSANAQKTASVKPNATSATEASTNVKSPPQASSDATTSPQQPSSQLLTQVENRAQKHIKAGEYQKAINVYHREQHKYPRDGSMMQIYAKGLDNIKSAAEYFFAKKDFAIAGKIYHVLKKNYGRYSHVEQMTSFNEAYLNTKLNQCKKALSVQGFQEYREGHLNNALLAWQGVLDIDPNNREIKEAMKTAKMQKKNLP